MQPTLQGALTLSGLSYTGLLLCAALSAQLCDPPLPAFTQLPRSHSVGTSTPLAPPYVCAAYFSYPNQEMIKTIGLFKWLCILSMLFLSIGFILNKFALINLNIADLCFLNSACRLCKLHKAFKLGVWPFPFQSLSPSQCLAGTPREALKGLDGCPSRLRSDYTTGEQPPI